MPIAVPAGFGWEPSFEIYQPCALEPYQSSLDYESMAPTGTAVYVDVATGSDSNTGVDWDNALQSIRVALDKLAADNTLHVVNVKSGFYGYMDRWDNQSFTQDAAFYAVDGPVTTTCTREHTWAAHGVQPNVYEVATRPYECRVIYDRTNLTAEGNATCMTLVTSVAEVNALASSFYDDGTSIYCRTFDDRAPDADIMTGIAIAGPGGTQASRTTYIEGFIFEASGTACINCPAMKRIVCVDCKFLYSQANNGVLFGSGAGGTDVYMIRCEASENAYDGFGYHNTDYVYEDTCVAYGNGRDVAHSSRNGSTSHGTAHVIRLNGTYKRSRGPNVIDANTAKSWNLGCTARNSLATLTAYQSNFWASTANWYHKCTSILDASTYDFYGGVSYLYDCTDEGSYVGEVIRGQAMGTTTFEEIRDCQITLMQALTPTSHSGVKFRANRAERDFRAWVTDNPKAFRRFAISDLADYEPPSVSNTDVEWVDGVAEVLVAYPNTMSLYGQAAGRDQKDVIREDLHQIDTAIGHRGTGNYGDGHAVRLSVDYDDLGDTTLLVIEYAVRFYRAF